MFKSADPHCVLVGAGHAHLEVLHNWRRRHRALPFSLTVVNPGPFLYSGMASGLLLGKYQLADMTVDIAPLVAKVGGVFIDARCAALDGDHRLLLDNGETLSYSIASFDIGGCIKPMTCYADVPVYPVKPIANLYQLANDLKDGERLLVIGAGTAGCEIACCLSAGFKNLSITIVEAEDDILPGQPEGARDRMWGALAECGVDVCVGITIDHCRSNTFQLGERSVTADRVILATGVQGDRRIRAEGWPVDLDQSVVDRRNLFAGGDCARTGLVKNGVHAVHAGRLLAKNLLRAAEGKRLKSRDPATSWLSIASTDHDTALATWGPLAWHGRWPSRLKGWIDRRYVARMRRT